MNVCFPPGVAQRGGPPTRRSELLTWPMRRCGMISGRQLRHTGRSAPMSGAGSNQGWLWLTFGETYTDAPSLNPCCGSLLILSVRLILIWFQHVLDCTKHILNGQEKQANCIRVSLFSRCLVYLDSRLIVLVFLRPSVPVLLLAVRSWRTAPGGSLKKTDSRQAWPSPPAAPSTTVLPTTPQTQETPPCCATTMCAKLTLEHTSTVTHWKLLIVLQLRCASSNLAFITTV